VYCIRWFILAFSCREAGVVLREEKLQCRLCRTELKKISSPSDSAPRYLGGVFFKRTLVCLQNSNFPPENPSCGQECILSRSCNMPEKINIFRGCSSQPSSRARRSYNISQIINYFENWIINYSFIYWVKNYPSRENYALRTQTRSDRKGLEKKQISPLRQIIASPLEQLCKLTMASKLTSWLVNFWGEGV